MKGPSTQASLLVGALAIALTTLVSLAALSVGPGEFSIGDVVATLGGDPPTKGAESILIGLRLPRLLLSLLVGASLGCAGALTQGLFRNPLASPGVLGLPSGAAAAVVAGFALGLDGNALWITPLLAFAGALGVLVVLFAVAGRRDDATMLLLSGVAMGALTGAATTCVLALNLDQWDLARRAMAWMMGSFDGRAWSHLTWATPPLVLGLLASLGLHRGLDLLFLGEESAASLGVSRSRFRFVTAAVVAVLVGAATAAVGALVFVGLVVPHLARAIVGPVHLRLLPASMLVGALLVLGIDTLGRAMSPTFLAPGALSSLLGGAFFLGLLIKQARGRAA